MITDLVDPRAPASTNKKGHDKKPDIHAEDLNNAPTISHHVAANPYGLAAAKDILVYVTEKDEFHRIDQTGTGNDSEEYPLTRDSTNNLDHPMLWMDQFARNVIISAGTESFYQPYDPTSELSGKPQKIKNLTTKVCSAVFNVDEPTNDKFELLVGTETGDVSLATSDVRGSIITAPFLPVAHLQTPVSCLLIHKTKNLKVVLATTSAEKYNLYHAAVGVSSGPILDVFESFNKSMNLLKDKDKVVEFKGRKDDKLCLLRTHENTLGWLTNNALLLADFSQVTTDPLSNIRTFTFPAEEPGPISFAITALHIILLFKQKVVTLSRLLLLRRPDYKQCIDWEHSFKGGVNGISVDSGKAKPTYWVYHVTSKISQLSIVNEQKNLWYIFMKLDLFDEALSKNPPPERREMIYQKQAQYHENRKEYVQMAKALARSSSKPFSEACLFFIHLNNTDALIAYLVNKLPDLRYVHYAHRTILATWLLELYLKKLDEISMQSKVKKQEDIKAEWDAQHAIVINFLKEQREELEKAESTVFQLLSTYGQSALIEEWTLLLNNNYDKYIERCIRRRDFRSILDLLKKRRTDVIYEQAPLLMKEIPEETVKVLSTIVDSVDIEKLIPAFLLCRVERNQQDPLIPYLEEAIKRSKTSVSTSVHNLLFSRYATNRREHDLEKYIRRPDSKFNLEFGLQFCLKEKKLKAAALIYARMGMYDEAVDTALEYAYPSSDFHPKDEKARERSDVGLELAKEIALIPADVEKRKQLMKQIVEFLISSNNSLQLEKTPSLLHNPSQKHELIQKAMVTVQAHADLLSIEDIIKDLPDDIQIADISNDLCQSLNMSKNKVQKLKSQRDTTKAITSKIKAEIEKLEKEKIVLPDTATCSLSKLPLKSTHVQQFYHFRDGYSFIYQNLVDYVETHFPQKKEVVNQYAAELKRAPDNEEVRKQLEETVAHMNPFYSDDFIKSIEEGFSDKEDEWDQDDEQQE